MNFIEQFAVILGYTIMATGGFLITSFWIAWFFYMIINKVYKRKVLPSKDFIYFYRNKKAIKEWLKNNKKESN